MTFHPAGLSRILRVAPAALAAAALLLAGAAVSGSTDGARGAGTASLGPWSVSLTASATSVPVGTPVRLTATASQEVNRPPAYGQGIVIGEEEGGFENYTRCGGDAGNWVPASTCAGSAVSASAGSITFIAQVWDYYAGAVLAESAPVTVTWTSETPSATPTAEPTATEEPSPAPGPEGAPTRSALPITLVDSSGEVTYRPSDSAVFQPLTSQVVLREGDTVSTGFGAEARFRIGQSEFIVGHLSEITINEHFRQENLERTLLYLRTGSIRADVGHTPSIRSDWSVETPTSSSSVRGTDFVVIAAEDGSATVYVVQGTVTFEDFSGTAVDITAGNRATVVPGAGINGPFAYASDETAAFPGATVSADSGASVSPALVVGAAALALAIVTAAAVLLRRRRTPAPA